MSSENLNNLSIKELKKLVKQKNDEVKKLEQEKEKEKLILAYKKLEKKEEKLIKENEESKRKRKEKEFYKYIQRCLKNKRIPKDIPYDYKRALDRPVIILGNGITPLFRSMVYEDEGMIGFTIKSPDFIHENIFIKLFSLDDYGILNRIDRYLEDFFRIKINSNLPEEIKEGGLLKKLFLALGLIKKREDMIIETNNVIAFHICFINIHIFIENYKNGFKHENKEIEKTFSKVGKIISEIMERIVIQ